MKRFLSAFMHDYCEALNICLGCFRIKYLVAVVLSCAFSWWCYVPIHELFHAFGCLIGGGQVDRLEIGHMYGAEFLKSYFPFIQPGSAYAGRLSGFDTRGNDFIYLLTDFFPYLLTIFIGIPLVKSVPRRNASPLTSSMIFGFAMPFAYAPFTSVTGDYYEMGSIVLSRFVVLLSPSLNPERWRSDDLLQLIEKLFFSQRGDTLDVTVVGASFLFGVILIFATYWAGIKWTGFMVRVENRIRRL